MFLLVIFVSVAYFFYLAEPGLSVEREVMLAELRERRAEWEEKRPPAFRYVVQRDCDCAPEYLEPFTVVESLAAPDSQALIDGFFNQLEVAIQTAEDVAVRYDPRFRYPNDFRIDGEQTYVRDFEVLQYD